MIPNISCHTSGKLIPRVENTDALRRISINLRKEINNMKQHHNYQPHDGTLIETLTEIEKKNHSQKSSTTSATRACVFVHRYRRAID